MANGAGVAAEVRTAAGPPLLLPLGLLVVATAIIGDLDLDRRLARLAFDPQSGWTFKDHWLVQCLYDYGTWPAILAATAAGLAWIGSFFRRSLWLKYRALIFLGMTIGLGCGLLVNTLFKGYYGRPRPAEMIEFGGQKEFRSTWQPQFASGSRSFPSGHASMGFCWLGLAYFYCRQNRNRAVGFALLGLFHGAIMGGARMLQGGHWLSDVLWAAGFVHLAAWILYRMVGPSRASSASVPDDRPLTGQ